MGDNKGKKKILKLFTTINKIQHISQFQEIKTINEFVEL
jgi:hypothetical protein